MASPSVPKAFEGFTRLGPNSYIYDPPSSSNPFADQPSIPHPDLILFSSWLDALPKHSAKYVDVFKTLYPCARIIVVTANITEEFTRSKSKNLAYYGPVVSVLQALPASANVLLHSISNGGGCSTFYIAEEYHKRTGAPLPLRAQILDSSPGELHYWQAFKAITAGLPKNPIVNISGKIVLAVTLALGQVWCWVTGMESMVGRMRSGLNRPDLFAKSAPRAYIYSREDEMVSSEDVESHMAQAEELGYQVSAELFEGSKHVSHMPFDKERYWNIVQSVWKSSFDSK